MNQFDYLKDCTGKELLNFVKERLAEDRLNSNRLYGEHAMLTFCQHIPHDIRKFISRTLSGNRRCDAYKLLKEIKSDLGEWKKCVDYLVKLNRLSQEDAANSTEDCV